jgi:signal transduction histidine kinase
LIRHLYIRIYLTTLASLVALVALSAVLWRYTADMSGRMDHDRLIATVLERALPASPPAATQAALDAMLMPPVEGVALFDADGRRLAGAGSLAMIYHLDDPRPGTRHGYGGMIHVIRLDDGRVVLARMHPNTLHTHLDGLAMIALIALGVGIGTYPIVRRLTRRLEALANSVDEFGNGNLSVRAPVSGEDEMARLAGSFNRMADRVARLLDAHRRMLANASHELRSPLARLRLALDLYEKQPDAKLMDGMKQDCTEIDAQIEEILLASKLDTLHPAPPTELVDLAVLLAEESARLSIPCDVESAPVRGDARLLRRLIRNLLENALKYGGPGVDSSVRVDERGERVLCVKDRGPGIAEAERERIFEPFYRPANAAETGSGWGLGLALVRQIADLHRGTVRCLPRDGGGCVFELRMPLPVIGGSAT